MTFRPMHESLPRTVRPRIVERRGPFARLGPEPSTEPTISERERIAAEVRAAVTAEVAAATEKRVRAELGTRIAALEARLPKLDEALAGVQTARREALHEAAADVAEMVRMLARRVLGHTLAVDPDALTHVIQEAVAALQDDRVTAIRVSPDLLDAVTSRLDAAWRDRVQPDPSVGAGARIDTETASVDATLDAAMAGVDRALGEWLEAQDRSR